MSTGVPRRARAAAALVAVAALAGCVALPTSGPVTAGDGRVREPQGVVVLAQGPQADAGPAEIVEGFLLAGAAEVTGDFGVAREYLVGDAREEWDPTAGAVVAGSRRFEVTGDAQVSVELAVQGKVDGGGRFTETSADTRESLRFELVEDADGDWRIAHAPDGLVLTPANLDQQYRQATLWFLTLDAEALVPEVRWFPRRNLETAIVKALLVGPSPWLRDAVRTAVPAGVELKPEAVVVEDGVAEVSLQPAQLVQEADRGLLLAQLERSLAPWGVSSVRVRAGTVLLDSGAAALPTPAPGGLEVLSAGRVLAFSDGQTVPVADLAPVAGAAPQGLARGVTGPRVALSDPGTLVTVPQAGEPVEVLASGAALAVPSVDRHGWVWTARSATAAPLVVTRPGGPVLDVTGDWLTGRTVEALRVSPEGTRVAVVSTGADGVTLDVAGVVRDDSGTPRLLGPPVRVGAQVVPTTSVVWADDDRLAVLTEDEAGTVPYLVPLSGRSTPLPAVPDAVALAAGRGERALHVVTSDGELLRYDGRTWVAVSGVTGVTGAAFPG
ncbi:MULTISPECIES: LpqB family beta-propeller domain-containing protein [Cellulomonas]|uniref:LpqB family beta-propeller domain-containing protein n=1 Tax=Cellulomonas TaxID=1707 RepID=UPI0010A8124D|nr:MULTISPECIES: LpqB family beta-propeller domain-containing protein [Cellulomonas]